MANFNTLTDTQIKNELEVYGYTFLASVEDDTTVIYYFEDKSVVGDYKNILKLSVDTTSYAQVYIIDSEREYINHEDLIEQTVVTDLDSFDALLIPVYSSWDPLLISIDNTKSYNAADLITPSVSTYKESTIGTTPDTTEFKVSEIPSPYRSKDVVWIPVEFIDPDWVLVYNNSTIVPTTAVVSNEYGDFIVLRNT